MALRRLVPLVLVAAGGAAIAFGAGSGCYDPFVSDCQYACIDRCPDGLVCNAEHLCVTFREFRCVLPDFDAFPDLDGFDFDSFPDLNLDGFAHPGTNEPQAAP